MARFVLDIANVSPEDIKHINDLVVGSLNDSNFTSGIISIKCIDETNENQFEDELRVSNGLSTNYFSDEQLKRYKEICDMDGTNIETQNPKYDNLFFPSATEWMWNYCIYLGSFVGMNGGKYDLGIYIDDEEVSAAIVYGNIPGQYYSGDLNRFGLRGDPDEHDEVYEETRRRAEEMKLYTPNFKERNSVKIKS